MWRTPRLLVVSDIHELLENSLSLVIYLMNRCWISRVHDISPHERFYGKKLDLSHVRIFGSITYVHIPDEEWQKVDPKSEKCILLGYSPEQKGYKCFNPSTRKVWVSRDVVFDKWAFWYTIDSTPSEPIKTTLNIDSEEGIDWGSH